MKQFSKTTTLLGIALVFTIMAAGAYTFFFIAMKNKTEATTALLASLGELSGKESRALSARLVLKNESARVEKLSSYFIKENEIVAFAKKIEELGPQSGTILTIQSLEPGFTEKTVSFLNFRVKATGKFEEVVRLLVLLENFPGKFEWKTVRLVRADGAPQTAATSGAPDWSAEVFLTALNFVKE